MFDVIKQAWNTLHDWAPVYIHEVQNQSTLLNEAQKLTECNCRIVEKAESPATWPHYNSSEPVTKGRNYGIKMVEHGR